MYEIHLTHYFLIVVICKVQSTSKTLDEMFVLLWDNSLLNAHVLIQEQPDIWSMYTFMPYQRDCYSLDPLKVATFTPQNFSKNINASLQELYPEKLDDFHNCSVNVAIALLEPFTYIRNDPDGTPQFRGIDTAILRHVARARNFSLIFKRSSTNSSGHGSISLNGTLTGNIALVSCLSFLIQF